jgi:hypothetical protein
VCVVGQARTITSELDATVLGSMALSTCGGAAHHRDYANTSFENEVHADRSDASEMKMK